MLGEGRAGDAGKGCLAKDQYFGDVNDYRKYGLLRVLLTAGELTLAVGWMMTPPDGSDHGKLRDYLREPELWHSYDEPLYRHLQVELKDGAAPSVTMLERSSLLPRTRYFSEVVPDGRPARRAWGERLVEFASGADLVFLDPDTGIEVPSTPIGWKDSSKYAAWSEIEDLSHSGSSVLVYQHYRRENREAMTAMLADELRERTGCPRVKAFGTANVVFLLAVQARHVAVIEDAVKRSLGCWQGQITIV